MLVQNRLEDVTADELKKLLSDCFLMATKDIGPDQAPQSCSLEDMKYGQIMEIAGQVSVRSHF